MKLSIIIPACNEAERIGQMLDVYLPFFYGKYGRDVQVLVSINGSRDSTEQVVAGYQEKYPDLECIVEPKKIGKGGGLIRGFKLAKGDLVGFADADGATPPEAMQDLVDSISDADAVIASRWCKGASVTLKQSVRRRIASRGFNLLVRLLFGMGFSDTQCGAKVMKKTALERVVPHLGVTQWAFDVDLLFQMKRAGLKVKEIPTTWHDVAGSQLRVGRASLDMLFALVRLRLVYSPFKSVVRLYNHKFFPFLSSHDEMPRD